MTEPHTRECGVCDGTGVAGAAGAIAICIDCQGTGTARNRRCRRCRGSGTMLCSCPSCFGHGVRRIDFGALADRKTG